MRCAQNLVKLPADCGKDPDKRCDHCKHSNRSGCTLVPKAMNSRLNRLYGLRDRYNIAVLETPGGERKTSDRIKDTGLKFARAQKQFNLELASRKVRKSENKAFLPCRLPAHR
ncbi:hypothetical protein PMIN03_006992 [Paraphaeosphaeria minitans]